MLVPLYVRISWYLGTYPVLLYTSAQRMLDNLTSCETICTDLACLVQESHSQYEGYHVVETSIGVRGRIRTQVLYQRIMRVSCVIEVVSAVRV